MLKETLQNKQIYQVRCVNAIITVLWGSIFCSNEQRTLTVRGRITVQLVSSLTRLDSIVSLPTNSIVFTFLGKI